MTHSRRKATITGMVTRIHGRVRGRLFLKEHREAKGLDAEQMAGRVGIERESYYRWERQPHRLNADKMALVAHALGIEPGDLWKPPGRPSLDALVGDADQATRETVFDIVRRLIQKAS